MFAIPRALHIAGEVHGDYLRHVRATSSFRTAGSLELEDRDSVQMNRNSKKPTSYCIQTFGQPSNMNPRCAYTSLHLYAQDTSHFMATFAQCILHVMQLLINLSSSSHFHHRFTYPCISLKTVRSSQSAVIEESAPPRELLRLSPIERPKYQDILRVEEASSPYDLW